MTIALSIIIPVYNAQNHIVETLNSILNGIPDDVEIIIVNDGSTDQSAALIKDSFSTQLESSQFSLIEQANAGVSVARNVGIEKSSGEYITFVDADDLLLKDYFSKVFSMMNTVSPDIIDIGFKMFLDEKELKNSPDMFTYNKFGLLNANEVICNVFAHSVFFSWARIVKRKTLKNLRFPAGVNFCEDLIFLHQLYQQSETIYHIDKALYAYRDNAQGATRNMKPDYLEAMLRLYQQLLKDKRPEISYLRVNVFYVIYRCCSELKKGVWLPFNVFVDSKKLAIKFLFDDEIPLRKKIILLMPNIHQKLAFLKSSYKSGS